MCYIEIIKTRRPGDKETRRQGDLETWRDGDRKRKTRILVDIIKMKIHNVDVINSVDSSRPPKVDLPSA